MDIAVTILTQLGGNRFTVMTGATGFVDLGRGLKFRLPLRKTNIVMIQLNERDYYDVTFYKQTASDCKTIHESEDVPAENLRSLFTSVTGLDTAL